METRAVIYSKAFPFAIDWAKNATIKDLDGNLYIDWVSGICVLNLGHQNPEVTEAVRSQMNKIWHALEVPTETRIAFLEAIHSVLPSGLKGDAKILMTVTESLNRGRAFNLDVLNYMLDHYIDLIDASKDCGLGVLSNVLFTRRYYPYLATILERVLQESQVDLMELNYMFMAGHATIHSDLFPEESQVESLYPKLEKLKDKFGERFGFCAKHVYLEAGKRSHYTHPKITDYQIYGTQVIVNPMGDVLPAPQATDPGIIEIAKLGNIKEESLGIIIERYRRLVFSGGDAANVQLVSS